MTTRAPHFDQMATAHAVIALSRNPTPDQVEFMALFRNWANRNFAVRLEDPVVASFRKLPRSTWQW